MMLLALLLSQVAAPPPADPQRPAPATIVAEPVALLFAGFDRDGDGRTTSAEVEAGLQAITREWGEGIGYIAYADWAERYLGDRNGIPTSFEVDRDGNNRVTPAELADRIDGLFTRLDRDKDGALTRSELLTIRSSPIGGNRPAPRGDRRPIR